MILALLIFVSLLLSSCLGRSAQSRIVVESLKDVPSGFVHHGAAPGDSVLDFLLALKQGNTTGLEQELYAVSIPGSEKYGKHLSKTEVSAMTLVSYIDRLIDHSG